MKLATCALMIACALSAVAQQTAPQTKKAPAKAPEPMTVPKDAVQVEPGLYHWTDKQGKGWMYRRSPFGVSRRPDTGDSGQQKVIAEQTSARAEGDSIRFEQDTPFGKRTWLRKKTELDETEQKIWARQQEKTSASRTAEKE